MLFVVRGLSFVDCSLPFVDLVFVVCLCLFGLCRFCSLFDDCCLLFVVRCLTFCYVLLVARCLLLVVCSSSFVACLLYVV